MLDKANFSIKIIIGSIFALVVLLYAYYQTRNLISGPTIEITFPENGKTFTEPLVEIIGVAKNSSRITLNDRPILIDESGNFKEKLLLSDGYNIIDFKAEDRFGERINKTLEVILK
ncbi:MAG: hypothetical protein AAB888_01095 [Patescibacteria group bacterium]